MIPSGWLRIDSLKSHIFRCTHYLFKEGAGRTLSSEDCLLAWCSKEDHVPIEGVSSAQCFDRSCKGIGNTFEFQHSLSSSDRWSNQEGKSNFGRHVKSLCPWFLAELGIKICRMTGFLTTTSIKPVYRWHRLKHYMDENAARPCFGMKQENASCLGQKC